MPTESLLGKLGRHSDVALAIAVVGVLLVLIVPVPTPLLRKRKGWRRSFPQPSRRYSSRWLEADSWVRNIHFDSALRGLAVDDCAKVVETVDGGLTWRRVWDGPFDGANMRDSYFADFQTGWVVGQGGSLFVTRDGANTWQRIYVPTQSELTAVYFADKNNGWLGGLGSALLSTSDGGTTWERVPTPNDCRIRDIVARLPLIWAIGECGGAVVSEDGGGTWESRKPPVDIDISSVAFLDSRTAWIGGRLNNTDRPVVLGTRDGGRTWQGAFEEPEIAGHVSEIVVQVTSEGFAGWGIGDGGLLLELVPPDQVPEITPTPVPVPASVAAAPPRDSLQATLTWERQREFTFDPLTSVEVVGTDRIYAGGEGGAIHRSPDGGASWVLTSTENHCWVEDLQFLSAEIGLTVDTCDGTLLTTEDGGTTWGRSTARPFDDQGARALHFLDLQTGWVAGDNGALARTYDGGNTWQRLDDLTDCEIRDDALGAGPTERYEHAAAVHVYQFDVASVLTQTGPYLTVDGLLDQPDLLDVGHRPAGRLWLLLLDRFPSKP